jgi:ADP-heptose:LPS heptosyltransferase
LQHGVCDDELGQINAIGRAHLTHWSQAINDCEETAALIAALDVVITVCSSVVHLAGALGKPTWVLVPTCPEWRYLHSGETMPWYPSVRLFRQSSPGDWLRPLAAIQKTLAAY